MKSTILLRACFALSLCFIPLPSLAQFELAAGGGLASYHEGAESSNKGKFQASAAIDFSRYFSVGFEYGYAPQSSSQTSNFVQSVSTSSHLTTYGGVVRVGVVHVLNVEPYVVIGFGGASLSGSESVSSGGSSGSSYTASSSSTDNGGYFGGGAGANVGLGGGLGVRPEVRFSHVSISHSGNFNELDVTGEIYYRFGSHHKRKH